MSKEDAECMVIQAAKRVNSNRLPISVKYDDKNEVKGCEWYQEAWE